MLWLHGNTVSLRTPGRSLGYLFWAPFLRNKTAGISFCQSWVVLVGSTIFFLSCRVLDIISQLQVFEWDTDYWWFLWAHPANVRTQNHGHGQEKIGPKWAVGSTKAKIPHAKNFKHPSCEIGISGFQEYSPKMAWSWTLSTSLDLWPSQWLPDIQHPAAMASHHSAVGSKDARTLGTVKGLSGDRGQGLVKSEKWDLQRKNKDIYIYICVTTMIQLTFLVGEPHAIQGDSCGQRSFFFSSWIGWRNLKAPGTKVIPNSSHFEDMSQHLFKKELDLHNCSFLSYLPEIIPIFIPQFRDIFQKSYIVYMWIQVFWPKPVASVTATG